MDMTITLKEALLGFTKTITHMDEHTVEIKRKRVTKPFHVKTIKGQGMPIHQFPSEFGDLHVKFIVEMPKQLTDEQKAIFKTSMEIDQRWLVDRRARGAPTFHFPKLLELQEKVFETMEEEQYIKKQKRGIVAKLGRNLTSTSSSRKKREKGEKSRPEGRPN